MDTPRTQTLRLVRSTLVVETLGDGPAVVLHPSLGRPAKDFHQLSARLASAGFTTVMINPRGVAGSTGSLDGLTLHDLAADVWGVVDELGVGRAHLVGHAFGNRVVRCAASDQPERTASVTLLAAGGHVPADPHAVAALRRCISPDATRAERISAAHTAFFARANDASVWADGWFPQAARAQGEAGERTPVDEWSGGGSAAMLVVQGLEDRIAPPQNGRFLVQERPDSRLAEIAGAAHALPPERPDAVADTVEEFLRDIQARPASRNGEVPTTTKASHRR